MQKPIINFTELLARVENDRELMRDLFLIFKDEFPGHLHALRDAVDSMDGDQVTKAAGRNCVKLASPTTSSTASEPQEHEQIRMRR